MTVDPSALSAITNDLMLTLRTDKLFKEFDGVSIADLDGLDAQFEKFFGTENLEQARGTFAVFQQRLDRVTTLIEGGGNLFKESVQHDLRADMEHYANAVRTTEVSELAVLRNDLQQKYDQEAERTFLSGAMDAVEEYVHAQNALESSTLTLPNGKEVTMNLERLYRFANELRIYENSSEIYPNLPGVLVDSPPNEFTFNDLEATLNQGVYMQLLTGFVTEAGGLDAVRQQLAKTQGVDYQAPAQEQSQIGELPVPPGSKPQSPNAPDFSP